MRTYEKQQILWSLSIKIIVIQAKSQNENKSLNCDAIGMKIVNMCARMYRWVKNDYAGFAKRESVTTITLICFRRRKNETFDGDHETVDRTVVVLSLQLRFLVGAIVQTTRLERSKYGTAEISR